MQKKNIFAVVLGILFLLILLITISISRLECFSRQYPNQLKKLPYTFDFDGPFYPNPSLVFEGPFPKVPKKMKVYRVKHPKITEASVRKLGQKFGMPSDAKLTRSRRLRLFWLKNSTQSLEVNPSNGSFNIKKIKKAEPQATTEKDYPSKEDCNRIAVKYLKERNLLPKDAYSPQVRYRSGFFRDKVMRVSFRRNIDGYETYGAGAKLRVAIGPGGEVGEVRSTWQQLVPYKSYPIKTPQKALEELQNAKGVLMNGCKGKVNKITFSYYTSPERQDFVQPIYFFDCNGPEGDFIGVVPAIKAEYLKSIEETFKEIEENHGSPGK